MKRGVAVAAIIVLAACGGGGGGAPVSTTPGGGTTPTVPPVIPSGPAQYTVSGAISVLSTAAVDSDTNDPIQTNTDNDSFDKAQAIPNPTLLTGQLNVKGIGNDGPNKVRGDLLDTYKVRLQAGQAIELDFSADPAQFDIDLFLFNASRVKVGESIRPDSRYECIRATQTGDYFIGVDVFLNAALTGSDSVYQLRISAPGGGGSSCADSAAAGSTVIPGEIIAEPIEKMRSSLSQSNTLSGMSAELGLNIKAGKLQEAGPLLYGLPASTGERAMRMGMGMGTGSMQNSSRGQTSAVKISQPALGYARRIEPSIDQETALILDTLAYAKLMQRSGQFKYAEPNRRMQSFQTTPTLVGTLPSNDQEYSRQKWHYDMISLPLAMQTLLQMPQQPTRRPIVAVIDTGIVASHPDLTRNLVAGFDFVSSITGGADGDGYDRDPDDSAPANSNPVFHGSHVAGTIAAEGFNGVGGLGVAPMARIMPLRALGAGGSGSSFDIIQAIRFAAGLTNESRTLPAERADVINLSLGGTGACGADFQAVFSAARAQGTIVVAASGNESANGLVAVGTPANCPGVIAVGAVNAQRTRSYYSNGDANGIPTLAVVAPGGDVRVSTTGNGQPDGIFSTVAQFAANGRQSTYGYLQGTSMASPHMAGVVALMRWVNPRITPAAVDDLISTGSIVEDLGAVGRDPLYGYGLINAKRAVDAAIASVGGTLPPPAQGRIEASPSAIDLGSIQSEVEFVVQRVGATSDTVASVTVTSNVISVAAGTVDASRLGSYRITANRNNITTAGQTAFSSVVVTTASGRTISINVSLSKPVAGGATGGSLGVIYIVAVDANDANLAPVGQVIVAQPINGVYNYTLKVTPINGRPVPTQTFIVAGSDLDNDGKICNRGEACGAYPFLEQKPTPIALGTNPNITRIDFPISPFGGISPSGLTLGSLPSQKQTTPSSLGIARQR